MSEKEIINATENENWLLNLIDAGQHQVKLLEQRVQMLEQHLTLINNKLTELIDVHNLCQKNNLS
jgi:hypothetical protein